MIIKLGVGIVSPKMLTFRSTKRDDDTRWHGNDDIISKHQAYWNFQNFRNKVNWLKVNGKTAK